MDFDDRPATMHLRAWLALKSLPRRIARTPFRKIPDYAGDPAAWPICWRTGHVTVNDIDDWLCLRCWTGFFMGGASAIKEEAREDFRNGTLVIWYDCWWHYGSAKYHQGDDRVVSLAQRLAAGPDTLPPSKGGPPYVFELRRL